MIGFIWFPTCRLFDLVGFNVAMASEAQFVSSMPGRIYKSMLVPLMQQDKRLGMWNSLFWGVKKKISLETHETFEWVLTHLL